MKLSLEQILAAYRHLDEGQIEAVLRILGAPPGLESSNRESMVSDSISLVAAALNSERLGNATQANRYFNAAFEYGVPLPALLRECGRYFKRIGEYGKAYCCYSLLQHITPGAISEFLIDLPQPELSRYSPMIVPSARKGPRPGLYALQPAKEALAGAFGAESAAMLLAHMTGQKSNWHVCKLPIVSLQSFAKARGLTYEEMAPGADTYLPPPPVFGGTDFSGHEARTRAFFHCVLADVLVSSKSNFLLTADQALLDHQDDELNAIQLNLDVDPIVVAAEDHAVTVMVNEGSARRPELEKAFWLAGVHTYNFGHWMIEFLPKVWACLDKPDFESVPILVDEQMPAQHLEALRLFVGPHHAIVVLKPGDSVKVKNLWVCSMLTYMPIGPRQDPDKSRFSMVLSTGALVDLINKVRPKLGAAKQSDAPRRIYLSRKDSQHRKLTNRREVEQWFAEHGFRTYDFEHIPFSEQLRLVQGADFIAGPDGSAFFLFFFARPGTRIAILNHPHLEDFEWYTQVCQALGLRFLVLTGDLVKQHAQLKTFCDYSIDLKTLPAYVDTLLAMS